jgi:hypothetical protein
MPLNIFSKDLVYERIALALLNANIADLASYDACYVPPASPVWEPVNIAAPQLIKVIKSKSIL